MAFRAVTSLCNGDRHPPPDSLIFPKKNVVLVRQTPHSPSPRPLLTTISLSVFMNFTMLGNSYKWNHTVFVLLCLASVT